MNYPTLHNLAIENLPQDSVENFVLKSASKFATAARNICQNGQGSYIEQMVTVAEGDSSFVVVRKMQKGQTTYTIHTL